MVFTTCCVSSSGVSVTLADDKSLAQRIVTFHSWKKTRKVGGNVDVRNFSLQEIFLGKVLQFFSHNFQILCKFGKLLGFLGLNFFVKF